MSLYRLISNPRITNIIGGLTTLLLLVLMPFCYQHNNIPIKSILGQADKAIIYIHDYENEQNPYRAIGELSEKEIRRFQLKDTKAKTAQQNCPFEGTIHFFAGKESLVKMKFNTQDDCQQIIYLLNDRLYQQSFYPPTLYTLKQRLKMKEDLVNR